MANQPRLAKRDWVVEQFKKGQLFWSGTLTHQDPATRDWSKYGGKSWNNWEWVLPYAGVNPNSMALVFPYDLYLIINDYRFPKFGEIGDYLVQVPDIGLQVYIDKKAKKF